jgi:dTDP-4-dehydrorhamnose reductase
LGTIGIVGYASGVPVDPIVPLRSECRVILVTGSNGQLGQEFLRLLGDQCVGVTHASLDITDPDHVEAKLMSLRPKVIINCAAYTAVDLAEKNSEVCFEINGTAVKHLATHASRINATLVQISTDYLFTGSSPLGRPWNEQDQPVPRGVYAQSKMLGEEYAATCPKHLIIRTCGLYGHTTKRANFVETMIRLGQERDELRVVEDQLCNPTSTAAVAPAIMRLVESDQVGVFNVVASSAMSWYEFACEIFRQSGTKVRVKPITSEQYGAPAPRPRYSVLDTSKFASVTGYKLPPIVDDLSAYLNKREAMSS